MSGLLSERQKDELYVIHLPEKREADTSSLPPIEYRSSTSFSHTPSCPRSSKTAPARRHKAMLSYLHAMGMHETYDALRRETENDEFDPSDAKAKWVGLLEKKWTSVIRLQKKVSSLAHEGKEA